MKTCNTGLFHHFLLTFQKITERSRICRGLLSFFNVWKQNKWKCYRWWLTQGDKGHSSPPFLKWLYKFLQTIFWFIMTISKAKLYGSKSIYFLYHSHIFAYPATNLLYTRSGHSGKNISRSLVTRTYPNFKPLPPYF